MFQSFLVHAPEDAVGVAVRDVPAHERVRGKVQTSGGEIELEVLEAIPLGHKIALRDIASGEQVVKYGVAIGRATREIRTGERVHIHNLKGERWA